MQYFGSQSGDVVLRTFMNRLHTISIHSAYHSYDSKILQTVTWYSSSLYLTPYGTDLEERNNTPKSPPKTNGRWAGCQK